MWKETRFALAGKACSASAKQLQEMWLGRLDDLAADNTTAKERRQKRLPPGLHAGTCIFLKSGPQDISGEIDERQLLSQMHGP